MYECGNRDAKMKMVLSTLWIFAVANYIYADVFTIFAQILDPVTLKQLISGSSGTPVKMTPAAMIGFTLLMETAMLMIPLARFLPRRFNRWTNVAIGLLHTVAVNFFYLIGGLPKAFTWYALFVIVETASTVLIIVFAWRWKESVSQQETQPAS
jgi:Family of unknown function (DUF6326)